MANKKTWLFGALILVVIAAIVTTVTLITVLKSDDETPNPDVTTPEPDENLLDEVWGYKCIDQQCKRVEIALNENTTSMNVCRLTCSDDIGTLLPKPQKISEMIKKAVPLDFRKISYSIINSNTGDAQQIFAAAWQRFLNLQGIKFPIQVSELKPGKELRVSINFFDYDSTQSYETDESYKLTVYEYSDDITATITAQNFFGVRHALETLDQLIVFDDFNDELVILNRVEIEDEPRFKHRGISVDTSRNFYPVNDIKRTIDGLAMVKMNVFHWHISDSQSMPMELKSRPELTKLGAYSPDKVYTAADIKDIVAYAKARGVRVIPEFDTPGHVGEGWQNTGLTVCYKDPSLPPQWRGQFDPTQDLLYDYLDDIYREMVEAFEPNLFHMGGDEVSVGCWNSSEGIQEWMTTRQGWGLSTGDFMNLWSHFQVNAIERLDKHLNDKIPIIVWTSSLTEEPYVSRLLDRNRYIIQIWLSGNDTKIRTLLENGYNLIMSNSDALYLDCGVGWWVDEGLNWCAPYKTWQTIYDNKMETIAGPYINQIYGAEATIWSESIDSQTIDMRIWPRASALAERLWTNSDDHWRKVEPRILWNNQRLSDNGLKPERLQLEWCFQNEGDCVSTL